MAIDPKKKLAARSKRKVRVRKRVVGTTARPRLCVFRSLKYMYAQIISDETGTVIASASTKDLVSKDALKVEGKNATPGSMTGAKALGIELAKIAATKNVKSVVFDRNGYVYHGRVASVAEGAREGGLEF